jgi:hypothetical protein
VIGAATEHPEEPSLRTDHMAKQGTPTTLAWRVGGAAARPGSRVPLGATICVPGIGAEPLTPTPGGRCRTHVLRPGTNDRLMNLHQINPLGGPASPI